MIAAAYGLSAQVMSSRWLRAGLILLAAGLIMAACDDDFDWERLAR